MEPNAEWDAAFYLRCLDLGYPQSMDSGFLVSMFMMAVHDKGVMQMLKVACREPSELGQKAYYSKFRKLVDSAVWQNKEL